MASKSNDENKRCFHSGSCVLCLADLGCTHLGVFKSLRSLLQISHSLGVKRLAWAYSCYGISRGTTKQAKSCNTCKDTSVSFPWPKKITCPNPGIRAYTLPTTVGSYSHMALEMARERAELEPRMQISTRPGFAKS